MATDPAPQHFSNSRPGYGPQWDHIYGPPTPDCNVMYQVEWQADNNDAHLALEVSGDPAAIMAAVARFADTLWPHLISTCMPHTSYRLWNMANAVAPWVAHVTESSILNYGDPLRTDIAEGIATLRREFPNIFNTTPVHVPGPKGSPKKVLPTFRRLPSPAAVYGDYPPPIPEHQGAKFTDARAYNQIRTTHFRKPPIHTANPEGFLSLSTTQYALYLGLFVEEYQPGPDRPPFASSGIHINASVNRPFMQLAATAVERAVKARETAARQKTLMAPTTTTTNTPSHTEYTRGRPDDTTDADDEEDEDERSLDEADDVVVVDSSQEDDTSTTPPPSATDTVPPSPPGLRLPTQYYFSPAPGTRSRPAPLSRSTRQPQHKQTSSRHQTPS